MFTLQMTNIKSLICAHFWPYCSVIWKDWNAYSSAHAHVSIIEKKKETKATVHVHRPLKHNRVLRIPVSFSQFPCSQIVLTTILFMSTITTSKLKQAIPIMPKSKLPDLVWKEQIQLYSWGQHKFGRVEKHWKGSKWYMEIDACPIT